jgi:hypothetical protein
MIRLLAFISCMLALTLALMAFEASVEAKSGSMLCKATAIDGKRTKWKCSIGQKCCYEFLTNKGSCVASSTTCF